MPSAEVLLAFTAAALILNISPGPSNLYVLARSVSQGARGGIVAALGLAVGSMGHVLAAVLGLSAIFAHSPELYTAVKLAGAAYLIYLGLSHWKNRNSGQQDQAVRSASKPLETVFRESIVVELTNPKTALFFLALLPQFVVPESGPVWEQFLILGIIVTISALPCDLLIAFSASRVARWLVNHERAQLVQDRISGSILFGLGSYIAFDELTSK